MRKNVRLVWDIGLLAVLCAATWGIWETKKWYDGIRSQVEPPVDVAPEAELNAKLAGERLEVYRADLGRAQEKHLKRLERLHKQFVSGLRNRGKHRFNEAREGIPEIVASMTSFGEMCDIVKDVALDKTQGGNRVETRCERLMDASLVQPCIRARESLMADFECHAADMAEESERYAEEVRVLFESTQTDLRAFLEAGLPMEQFDRDVQSIYAAMREQADATAWTSVGVVLEALTIRGTIASFKVVLEYAIRKIAAFVAKQCGKAAAKAAVSAGLPFVDGPIPVGDIIAVGGFIWTAADVYELCRVLPRKLQHSLRETVDDLQKKTLLALEADAEQLYQGHVDFARQVHAMALGEGEK